MVKYTKVIGITGGVGSGKSHVCKLIYNHLGYPVIDSDEISRNQMQKGSVVLNEVVAYFGKEILNEDGSLDQTTNVEEITKLLQNKYNLHQLLWK